MTKFAVTILFLCFSLFGFSQVNDAGLWLSVDIKKKFTQTFSLQYSHSTRFNENITKTGSVINELGVNYRFNKKSKVSLFYRFNMQRELNNMYVPVSRFYVDYSYGLNPGNFDLDFRLRFQSQQKNVSFYDFDDITGNAIRPKISLKTSVRKFEPYVFGELFIPIFDSSSASIDKIRIGFGLEYEINKRHSIDVGYMIQKELYEKNPETDFVIKIGYKFNF
jgi:hypothetical protein